MSSRRIIESLLQEIAGSESPDFVPGDVIISRTGGVYPEDAFRVVSVDDGITIANLGGGFVRKIRSAFDWRKVSPSEMNLKLRPANFDAEWENKVYPGFHDGRRWNGWSIPYFTKEVADQILQSFFDEGTATYDSKTDTYTLTQGKEEDNQFIKGESIDGKKLYQVGDGWTWSLADEQG